MKVVNAGDWARDALQLTLKDGEEYRQFVDGLVAKNLKVAEIVAVNGSQLTAHYLFIEGRQTLVYVPIGGTS